ncbi:MAG: DUF3592 domain-containing protein [Pseudomonadota bacterium]
MSKNTKIVIGLLAVCAVFVGLIGYWATMRRAGQSEAVMATVVSAERETGTGKRKKENTIVTLSYLAGSATANGRARVSGVHISEYPAGRSVRICYDPKNTTSIRIDDGPCG